MLTLGCVSLFVIHSPGHTPGSICLRFDRRAIVADTLFPGGTKSTSQASGLRTRSFAALQASLAGSTRLKLSTRHFPNSDGNEEMTLTPPAASCNYSAGAL